MKALLMSAGLGTRLGSLTKRTPKPLVKVNGVPTIHRVINHLKNCGVHEFIINLHYKPMAFMNYFGRSVLYLYEPKLLGEEGTIQTLIATHPSIAQEYLLVANADTLTNLDVGVMFQVSNGKSVQSVDQKKIYTGIKILSPEYLQGISKKVADYYNENVVWQDMGTPEGLKKARILFK